MEQGVWSFSAGVILGFRLRIHLFFVLYAIVAFFGLWNTIGQSVSPGEPLLATLAAFSALMLAGLIHLAGHLLVCHHLETDHAEFTLVPWGDWSEVRVVAGWPAFFVAVGGVTSNLLAAALGLILCTIFFSETAPWFLLHPFDPGLQLQNSLAQQVLYLFVWANWATAIVNLLPVYPFDGSKLVSSLVDALQPTAPMEYRAVYCRAVSQLAGVGLIAFGVLLRLNMVVEPIPSWLCLILLGVVSLFGAQFERPFLSYHSDRKRARQAFEPPLNWDEIDYHGDDTNNDYELDNGQEEQISEWLNSQRDDKSTPEYSPETDAQVVDRLLEKISNSGLESLSPQERGLLDRISARLRKKPREKA